MRNFVHLHCHTTYSIGDAINYPDAYVKKAIEIGHNSLAITEHGNMNSFGDFYLHIKENELDFKPIFGQEFYIIDSLNEWKKSYELNKTKKDEDSEDTIIGEDVDEAKINPKNELKRKSHIVLLAKSYKGLQNLFQLTYFANKNIYYVPRIDFNLLEKFSEDLICLTGCIGGVLASKILYGDEIQTLNTLEKLIKIFSYDRLFLELQGHNLNDLKIVNKKLIQLSCEFGLNLIATNDCHYPEKNQWKNRELIKAMKYNKKREDVNLEYNTMHLYMMTKDELLYYFDKNHNYIDKQTIYKAIGNTLVVDDMIEKFDIDTSTKLNSINGSEENDYEVLSKITKENLINLNVENKIEYEKRLDKELNIIKQKKFSSYVLNIKEILDSARKNDIAVGCGRGSSAGSLICYLLNITQIDPIKNNLLFERFIDISRNDLPDVDTDLSDNNLIKEVLKDKYGETSVASISTYAKLRPALIIKDIARFYNADINEVNEITKIINTDVTRWARNKSDALDKATIEITLDDVVDFAEQTRNKKIQIFMLKYYDVFKYAKELQNEIRQIGRHAGGMVIYPDLYKHTPIIMQKGNLQTAITQGTTIKKLEKFGFVKFDLLKLDAVKYIYETIRLILNKENTTFNDISDWYNKNIHPHILNENDRSVINCVFEQGHFEGIFQFTEDGIRKLAQNSKIRKLSDINNIIAIYRPGPLSQHADKIWISYTKGKYEPEFDHPLLKEIFEDTAGICLFQEQIMETGKKIGLLDDVEANALRKLIVSHKEKDKKEKLKNKFYSGAKQNNFSVEQIDELWTTLENMAAYAFNKSHSTSYYFTTFQTAYLRTYYPIEWLLTILKYDFSEQLINEIISSGYNVRVANINDKNYDWKYEKENNCFVFPLRYIKNIGDKAAEEIIKNQPYKSFDDFINNEKISFRVVNKRKIEILINSGCFDLLEKDKTKKALCKLFKKEENIDFKDEYTEQEIINFTSEHLQFVNYAQILQKYTEDLKKQGFIFVDDYDIMNLGRNDDKEFWSVLIRTEKRKTKNGKTYYMSEILKNNKKVYIKAWNQKFDKEKLENTKYGICVFDGLKYDNWGFSCDQILVI